MPPPHHAISPFSRHADAFSFAFAITPARRHARYFARMLMPLPAGKTAMLPAAESEREAAAPPAMPLAQRAGAACWRTRCGAAFMPPFCR